MFARPAQTYASAVAAWILRQNFRYATFIGVNWFGVSHNSAKNCLIAESRFCSKWFSLLLRVLLCSGFYYNIIDAISSEDNFSLIWLLWMQLFSNLVFQIIIIGLQFFYERKVQHVINSFLRLFQNVNTLTNHDGIFDGKSVLSLLICNLLSLVCGFCGPLPKLFEDFNIYTAKSIICKIYASVNAEIIFHIICLGYLSVTTLYDQLNSLVRHELQRQIRDLGQKPSLGQLKAAITRVDACLSNYDEIYKLAKSMQRFLDLPLLLFLFFSFLKVGLIYTMLIKGKVISLTIFVIKNFADILLVTLSIDRARRSSRIMRRLSLENYYVGDSKKWHSTLEMFLSRLNYNEFHVRPFGLFEISNELIVVLLSGMVTCLTYIMQHAIQSNET